MIRELIDYYIEQKLTPQLEKFVLKDDHKASMATKLDMSIFTNFRKEQMQKEAANDKDFKTDERLF